MLSFVDAVAFDLDGTLYPNAGLYVRLVPFVCTQLPLLLAFGKARNMLRTGSCHVLPGETPPGFYDCQSAITANLLGADPGITKEKIERLIYRGWEPHFKKVRLFPHVPETLDALRRAGLKLGLLSDFPPLTKIKHLGIGDCWDAVICSEETGALKPDARPFAALAAALEADPRRILYVGNSRRYDVLGARRAGMKTALIASRSRARTALAAGTDLTIPDFAFHDYRQLRDYMLQ